jgi:exonuclease III
MAKFLHLAVWNANGLTQHKEQLKMFLSIYDIDVMLISETHFKEKNLIRMPHCIAYHTDHLAGMAREGTTVFIKSTIQHHQLCNYEQDFLQATIVTIEDIAGLLTISAVYLPPKHTVKQEQLEDYYNTLGHRFIAGGDYNANHTDWGSRLTSSRGREINKTITSNNYKHLSTGESTYWPTDMNKLPDLVDSCVTKGILQDFADVQSCFDLPSDHYPILVTLSSQALRREHPPSLCNRRTNFDEFRNLITEQLKTAEDIEATVQYFSDTIQWACWNTTPEQTSPLKTNEGLY